MLTPAPRFQHRQTIYLQPDSRLHSRRVREAFRPMPAFTQATRSRIGELLLVLGPESIQPGQFLWPI